eukprot:1526117-Rhodomonas_salina.2
MENKQVLYVSSMRAMNDKELGRQCTGRATCCGAQADIITTSHSAWAEPSSPENRNSLGHMRALPSNAMTIRSSGVYDHLTAIMISALWECAGSDAGRCGVDESCFCQLRGGATFDPLSNSFRSAALLRCVYSVRRLSVGTYAHCMSGKHLHWSTIVLPSTSIVCYEPRQPASLSTRLPVPVGNSVVLVDIASAEKEGWFVSTLAGGIVVGNQEGVGRDAAFSFMQRSDWFVGIALTRDGRSAIVADQYNNCLLYTSPSPRDRG